MRRLPGGGRFTFRGFLRERGIWPVFRLGVLALRVMLGRVIGPGGPERDLREARLLAAALGDLKGPYAKVGQFAAVRLDTLATPIRETLATLRDRVPPLPFEVICEVVEQELGGRLEDHFERFDPEPLGAASIAQAHRARTQTGDEVVVKVQYPWLARSIDTDLALLHWLLARVTGPGRDPEARDRLFAEFAAGIRGELDFEHEARVAAEIAENLAQEAQIVVPRIDAERSTGRVLTMAWHPTIPIHDAAGLDARGVPRGEIVAALTRAYAQQIFVDGLFHADPHPGNLFVLDEPEASTRPRVLFVDFGLSRRLSPELRQELRAGIYALLQSDLDAFVAGMQRLQMIAPGAEAGVRSAVSSMFERIRSEGGGGLGMGAAGVLALKDEAKLLLEETPGLQLPTDLLLYAKTLSYLLALSRDLAPDVDPMKTLVPYLLRFLATKE